MILFLGDIHACVGALTYSQKVAREVGASAIIQVGDFGLFPDNEKQFASAAAKYTIPTYFIDGNHDNTDRWTKIKDVTRVFRRAPLYYVPRGTVMDIAGRTIAFMGGAGSIDKAIRLSQGANWSESENISLLDIGTLMVNAENRKVDIFVTHCPPNSIVKRHFDKSAYAAFQVPLDWHDPNQDVIEALWAELGHPQLFCGHMHRRVIGSNYRILDIDEMASVE